MALNTEKGVDLLSKMNTATYLISRSDLLFFIYLKKNNILMYLSNTIQNLLSICYLSYNKSSKNNPMF